MCMGRADMITADLRTGRRRYQGGSSLRMPWPAPAGGKHYGQAGHL